MARLWVDSPLEIGMDISLNPEQGHYLRSVLRLSVGSPVLVFNGRDGEWKGLLSHMDKRHVHLHITQQTRSQPQDCRRLHLFFAPLKQGPMGIVTQKATELGVSTLTPILTDHTVVRHVNADRARAHMIEATEQCGRLTLPTWGDPLGFDTFIQTWPAERLLIIGDERRQSPSLWDLWPLLLRSMDGQSPWDIAYLVGPEGGFSEREFRLLDSQPSLHTMRLNPHILRAETAVIAGLSLLAAALDTLDTPR